MIVRFGYLPFFFFRQAAYDAYLTGCCFAAAATVGLGVGLGELKGMARGGETPPVMNVVPLYRVVSDRVLNRFRGGVKFVPPTSMFL